jgi:glycosyltransferase involved in cell wall biosynthesis
MASLRAPAALIFDHLNTRRRPDDWEIRPTDLRGMLRSGDLLRHLFRHSSARLLVDDVAGLVHPKAVLTTRLLTHGPAWIEDRAGRIRAIDTRALARLLGSYLRDLGLAPFVLRAAHRRAAALEAAVQPRRPLPRIDRSAGVLFLRTDFLQGLAAGGSLAHLAGVLNQLAHGQGRVDLLTTDPIPLIDPAIKVRVVHPEHRTWTNAEIHQLHFNRRLESEAATLAAAHVGGFIYQRHSGHNWTGAALSRRAGLAFVLEFNGSHVWTTRNWVRPLRHEALAARLERANLMAADLVTVVSEPLRDVVREYGIPAERVFVNPNGVDAERFTPQVEGGAVRRRYDLGARLVIGFIGTFGPWHGVEVLAEAFARLLDRRGDLADRVRLLLIGDGDRMSPVQALLRERRHLGETVFTGLVPQSEGAEHLAACDILCVPTVPNRDGSPFFGSPTKLFECMAMGRPIVASALGQVADILADGRTALLHPAADSEALAHALERLIDDPDLRERLGAAARAEVVARHTWRHHVGRLRDKLSELGA